MEFDNNRHDRLINEIENLKNQLSQNNRFFDYINRVETLFDNGNFMESEDLNLIDRNELARLDLNTTKIDGTTFTFRSLKNSRVDFNQAIQEFTHCINGDCVELIRLNFNNDIFSEYHYEYQTETRDNLSLEENIRELLMNNRHIHFKMFPNAITTNYIIDIVRINDINNNPHFLVKSDFAKIYQEINDAEYKNLLKFNLLNDMNEFNIFHTI